MTLTAIFLYLALFAVICYVQNAAFTWSSRSRNSGDPEYHRKAALASNGVYYLTNALLTLYLIKFHAWYLILVQGVIYTISTAEGSVAMMKRLLKKEAGKRKVGNQFTDYEVQELRRILDQDLRSRMDCNKTTEDKTDNAKVYTGILPLAAMPCAGVSLEKAPWKQ